MFVCKPNSVGVIPILDNQPILAVDSYRGGWVNRMNGELHISTTNTPARHNEGFAADDFGRLCVSLGGVISHFIEGIPVTENGSVVGRIDDAPLANDPFIAGIRVGINGVYLI